MPKDLNQQVRELDEQVKALSEQVSNLLIIIQDRECGISEGCCCKGGQCE